MGGKNARFRATVIHAAARAAQAPLKRWGVSSVVGADLAWYLLLDSPSAIKEWKLEISVQKYQGSVFSLAQRLAATDPRFSILVETPTVMLYTHDVLHDGSLLKKRSCDIILIDAMWPFTTRIKDVACFPFQTLLFQRMNMYRTTPDSQLEHQMLQDVAASKAYLASKTSIRSGGIRAKDEAKFNALCNVLCTAIPDAEETFNTLGIEDSSLAMNNLKIANAGVDERNTRPQSSPGSSFPNEASTTLAVGARASTPETSPTGPVIRTQGYRAVVFRAAEEVIRILYEAEYTVAILGSTACYLYGNGRLPKDIDILVSSHHCDREKLKEFIVAENPNFYLIDAKKPEDRWKVLWYRDRGVDGKFDKTKVDILTPGGTTSSDGLPVVPMSILLLHKLQGWRDNMQSEDPRFWAKYDADVGDVCSLLRILFDGMSRKDKKNLTHWKRFALERFDEEFRDATEDRVECFCRLYPAFRDMWQKLGW
ncbi:hypothetical protein EDD18DRAFT_1184416 [Armillaria luteobubalina]|uniref:Uncharacterized protein n=1 Tax=Armillaria luteobubalina TaxID=153913 RepID=A0AA39UL32_9AGAR|nr:hypothetical protein EDD18DRAFT_1184416 [Armillaria luteobubalina]